MILRAVFTLVFTVVKIESLHLIISHLVFTFFTIVKIESQPFMSSHLNGFWLWS